MKRTFNWTTRAWLISSILVGVSASLILAGCDVSPSPQATRIGIIADKLAIAPGDTEELKAVTAMEQTLANYQYRLEVLRSYYQRVGNMDKYNWATNEINNVRRSKTFTWEGLPSITPAAGESVENADERVLVEYVVAARKDYLAALDALESFYFQRDPKSYKGGRIRNMKDRLDPVYIYIYFLEAEMPPADLKPVEVIPEADRMYDQAVKLFGEGKGPLHFAAFTDYNKERRALVLFRDLIRKYPRSTKIALSAYYIADIYKEYFNEDVRAVAWYERAWTWDPNITEPARFQAATVYDQRLHNRAKAVECYRLSMRSDPSRLGNFDHARKRIEELEKAPAE